MNDLSVFESEEEMRPEGNVHLLADGLDQAQAGLGRLGVADDGLALVDGQQALHRHGDWDGIVNIFDGHLVQNYSSMFVVAINQ